MNWNMSWTLLLLAIIFEVIGTSAIKMSQGFTKLGPSILLIIIGVIGIHLGANAQSSQDGPQAESDGLLSRHAQSSNPIPENKRGWP